MIKTNKFRLLCVTKDGGAESRVWAFWLFAWKALCSLVLLRFEDGSRDAFHSHAFDCISWVVSGVLLEEHRDGSTAVYWPSWRPIITRRATFHRVTSFGCTRVISLRGPWADTWKDAPRVAGGYAERVLTHGRQVVG
jgi:hypothetical protein